MVICLERGADLHMTQLMPLPLTVSYFSKIQIGFTFLVPAHPSSPGQRAVKRVCVCVPALYMLVNKSSRASSDLVFFSASMRLIQLLLQNVDSHRQLIVTERQAVNFLLELPDREIFLFQLVLEKNCKQSKTTLA